MPSGGLPLVPGLPRPPSSSVEGLHRHATDLVRVLTDILSRHAHAINFNDASGGISAIEAEILVINALLAIALFYSDTQPADPFTGMAWLNKDTGIIKVWDGAAWVDDRWIVIEEL